MRRARLAFLAGFALVAIALALTLAGAPMSVARTNNVAGHEAAIGTTTHGATYCQAHEVLPSGTSAIRIWLEAAAGPAVRVAVYSEGSTVASGRRGSIWIGGSVTVAVRPLASRLKDVTVCISFELHDETITIQGDPTPSRAATREGRRPLGGRMGIEYLRAGKRSWASLAGEVAKHMGLGRAAPGTWVVYVALALLAALIACASRLVLRELP